LGVRVEVWTRLPFRVYEAQNDGNLHSIEALPTLDDAKTPVRELGEVWQGEYAIDNEETGERTFGKRALQKQTQKQDAAFGLGALKLSSAPAWQYRKL
jgi:hypothetical protein